MLVILSGVAGSGKDTIKKEIIKRMDGIESIPSFTTRPQREGDIPGQTSIFISKEEFNLFVTETKNSVYTYCDWKGLVFPSLFIVFGIAIVLDLEYNKTNKSWGD